MGSFSSTPNISTLLLRSFVVSAGIAILFLAVDRWENPGLLGSLMLVTVPSAIGANWVGYHFWLRKKKVIGVGPTFLLGFIFALPHGAFLLWDLLKVDGGDSHGVGMALFMIPIIVIILWILSLPLFAWVNRAKLV